jgi:hypothetical protein
MGRAAHRRKIMKRIVFLLLISALFPALGACSKDSSVITTRADLTGRMLTLVFEKGANYSHTLELNRFMTTETTPQIAVWIEDTDGNYIDTLFVTKKSGTQGWVGPIGLPADSIRRPEALPCWSHKRGVVYADGYYMPTKDNPLPDAITAASPAGDFHLLTRATDKTGRFVIKAEVNNSADFNDAFPKNATHGDPNYSGGSMGSGQPSIVYSATADLSSGPGTWELLPVGHGSPDGRDGSLDPDLGSLTTAKDIIKRITISTR